MISIDRMSSSKPTESPSNPDSRTGVRRARGRQQLRWGMVAALLLVLLSTFSGGLFLYATLVVGLLLGLSTLLTTVSLDQLTVARRLSSGETVCGEVVDAWLVVHNRKQLPASGLFWRDQVEPGLDVEGPTSCATSLQADERRRLKYRLHSTRRGLYRIGPAMIEASDPFGLVKRFRLDGDARFLTVLPRSVEIGRGWPLGHRPIHEVPRRRSLFEDPSRFLGIRRYRRGDSLRRVHWRATARSGKLQVKLFEPAVLEGVLVAIEMAEGAYPPDDPRTELAVTAAASIADFVLAGDQPVGLLANGADAAERYPEDWSGDTFRRLEDVLAASETRRKVTGFRPLEAPAARGGWQRDRLMAMLARLVPAPGPRLAEVLTSALPRLPRSLVLMIVTPNLDAALADAVASLERSGLEVAVVWIAAKGDSPVAELSRSPIYTVCDESDLDVLGGRRL